MSSTSMRLWIQQIQEAHEGEISLQQTAERNEVKYDQEADRLKFSAGGEPQDAYAKIKSVADFLDHTNKLIDELSNQLSTNPKLKNSPAAVILSKLKSLNLDQHAQKLDQIAKMPAPSDDKP